MEKKARLVEQIRRLWKAERASGGVNPTAELLLDLEEMSEEALLNLSKTVAVRLTRGGVVRTTRPEPVPVEPTVEGGSEKNLFGETVVRLTVPSRPRRKRDRIMEEFR